MSLCANCALLLIHPLLWLPIFRTVCCLSSIAFALPFSFCEGSCGSYAQAHLWFTDSGSMSATSPLPIFLLLALLTCCTTSDRCLLDTYHMSRNLLGTGVLDDSISPTTSSSYAGARLLFNMNSLGGLPMALGLYLWTHRKSCPHVPVPASFVTAVLNCGFVSLCFITCSPFLQSTMLVNQAQFTEGS